MSPLLRSRHEFAMTILESDDDRLFGGIAMWRRIADAIRLAIVGGKLARGEKLPGEIILPVGIIDHSNCGDLDRPFEERPCPVWEEIVPV